jgi:hypothetical protein
LSVAWQALPCPAEQQTRRRRMALKNPVWRESTFDPPGAEPGLTYTHDYFENAQNMAVQIIARERFAFPSEAFPLLKTYVNRPEHTIGVRSASGDLLFPDIVVMNSATTEVRMLAEVETKRSLYSDDIVDKWKAFIAVGKLFIYVPLEDMEWARKVLRAGNVRPEGVRTWKLNMGQSSVDTLEMSI